jgi:hypothetical protein
MHAILLPDDEKQYLTLRNDILDSINNYVVSLLPDDEQ